MSKNMWASLMSSPITFNMAFIVGFAAIALNSSRVIVPEWSRSKSSKNSRKSCAIMLATPDR
eukprot:CAMPEP_0176249978 /NCGR_PEP_ID=MMETSP0121_2-20121125/34249_1 /TAXON_ID=160619 /ORGANISM="Kryptoperidinium foliaceum, Strain CCMP 1326" /LENGTH=61 /DNA_ID=CAMNT_0017589681 /DNA_START=19 /DNA_END=200 /DNA_ORIENTATION=+